MFGTEFGTQISWLLPAALILLVAGIVWRGTRPRTDRVRAAFVLWGGWLLVTGLVFSLGKGIIHQYYAIALAPAIGALVGMGAGMLWKRRHDVDRARGARGRRRGHRDLDVRAARPHPRLEPVVARAVAHRGARGRRACCSRRTSCTDGRSSSSRSRASA